MGPFVNRQQPTPCMCIAVGLRRPRLYSYKVSGLSKSCRFLCGFVLLNKMLLDAWYSEFPYCIFVSCVVFLYLYALRRRLGHVPGPFFASLTNIPRAWWVWTRNAHEIHLRLHRKYGPLVRMGPNMVSITNPADVSIVYNFEGRFKKANVLKFHSRSPADRI